MTEEFILGDGLSTFPQETSDLMRALFATVDDGIIVSDQNGKIVFGNDAALRINDYEKFPPDPKDRIHHYTSRVGNAERPITVAELPSVKTLVDGEVKGHELILTSSKGRKKTLLCNGRALYDSAGKKVGAVLVFRDNTLQLANENQRADLEKERVRLLHMNAELEHFSAIAAHDLKSPLNSITQFAELIKDDFGDKLGPQGSELLQYIMNAGNRLRTLIDDLLTYARAGKDLGELTSFDLRILVDEILVALNGQLQNSSASLDIGFLPVVFADRIGLSQVFQNLISNALKYRSKRDPVIKISAMDEDDSWKIQIEDNGIGIRQEDQGEVFDLFKRVDGSQQAEGTGLGLPICKRIIEFHGGKIWLTSTRGVGTIFNFTLPKSSERPSEIRVTTR